MDNKNIIDESDDKEFLLKSLNITLFNKDIADVSTGDSEENPDKTNLEPNVTFNATNDSDDSDDGSAEKRNIILSIVAVVISFIIVVIIGIVGFAYIFKLNFIDALHNSSMYVTGMGPVASATTTGQKAFASFYSVLGGFLFLGVAVYFIDEIVDIVFFTNRSQ